MLLSLLENMAFLLLTHQTQQATCGPVVLVLCTHDCGVTGDNKNIKIKLSFKET